MTLTFDDTEHDNASPEFDSDDTTPLHDTTQQRTTSHTDNTLMPIMATDS